MLVGWFGGGTVGWSFRNFSRIAEVGGGWEDRRPSSQLRSDAKGRPPIPCVELFLLDSTGYSFRTASDFLKPNRIVLRESLVPASDGNLTTAYGERTPQGNNVGRRRGQISGPIDHWPDGKIGSRTSHREFSNPELRCRTTSQCARRIENIDRLVAPNLFCLGLLRGAAWASRQTLRIFPSWWTNWARVYRRASRTWTPRKISVAAVITQYARVPTAERAVQNSMFVIERKAVPDLAHLKDLGNCGNTIIVMQRRHGGDWRTTCRELSGLLFNFLFRWEMTAEEFRRLALAIPEASEC